MTSPSPTTGKSCVECGIPDPYIFNVASDFPEAGEEYFWPKEGTTRFKLSDDDFGYDGIITITYQCDNSGTHEAWLEEESENNRKILRPFGKSNNVTLYYGGFRGGANIINVLRSPWEYLDSVTMPHDVLYEPAHYTIRIGSCYEYNSYVEIKVYPSSEIWFTTGLSYEISSSQRTRAVEDQRNEWRKAQGTMGDTRPKDRNKPRSG